MPDLPPYETNMVNDYFWLGEGKKMVEGALPARSAGATQLITAVGWFWTAYTAVAIAGLAVFKNALPLYAQIVLLLPSVILIGAYSLATQAALPVELSGFDPRIPTDVETVYYQAAAQRATRLGRARRVTFLGAVTVIAAIGVAVLATSGGRSGDLLASYTASPRMVVVGGSFPENQQLTITVTPVAKAGPVAVLARVVKTKDNGRLDEKFELADDIASDATFTVRVEWTKDDVRRTVERTVKQ